MVIIKTTNVKEIRGMEYFKINSLWKREGWYFDEGKKNSPQYQKGKQSLIVGDYARPEFGIIRMWRVEEKIDGTNIRITFMKKDGQLLMPSIEGRTEAASIHPQLLKLLQGIATWDNFNKAFKDDSLTNSRDFEVQIFGEGYGPKIQACGGKYRKDVGFIIFDIRIGKWWMTRESMREIASKLHVPSVPNLGTMTEAQIVEFVKSQPMSRCSETPQVMEGIVARPDPLMLFRDGTPVIFKLKCKEFI